MNFQIEKFAQVFAWICAFFFLLLSGSFLFLLVRNGINAFYLLNLDLYPIWPRLFPAIVGTATVIVGCRTAEV